MSTANLHTGDKLPNQVLQTADGKTLWTALVIWTDIDHDDGTHTTQVYIVNLEADEVYKFKNCHNRSVGVGILDYDTEKWLLIWQSKQSPDFTSDEAGPDEYLSFPRDNGDDRYCDFLFVITNYA